MSVVVPFSHHHTWILFRGASVNPLLILIIEYLHCFTTQPTFQTRSKYGPTLKAGYVVLPVITSRPLRLPYARRLPLAGFIRLESDLLQQEYCRDAGISGSTSLSFTACRWPYSGFPVGASTLCFPTDIGLLHQRRRSACIPVR